MMTGRILVCVPETAARSAATPPTTCTCACASMPPSPSLTVFCARFRRSRRCKCEDLVASNNGLVYTFLAVMTAHVFILPFIKQTYTMKHVVRFDLEFGEQVRAQAGVRRDRGANPEYLLARRCR